MEQIKFIFSKIKNYKKKFAFALFITALCGITGIIAPVFIPKIIDNGISENNIPTLIKYSIIYLMFQLSTIGFETLGLYLSESTASKILVNYKSEVLNKLCSMQVNNFYEYEPYEFRGMISYNIDNLKFFFADLPRVLVEILIIIFVSCFYITSISAEVFGFIFICIIIYVISYLLTRKVLHNLSEERYTLDKKYYDKIISICKNIDEFFFKGTSKNFSF